MRFVDLTPIVAIAAIIWVTVEGLRWHRVYGTECKSDIDKNDALVYSSCNDPMTVVARYAGNTYNCDQIRNDVKLGPLGVSIERWVREAYWWPEHPYRRISENTWALTAIACVSIATFIGSIFWMWSTERAEHRFVKKMERESDRMDRQQTRMLDAIAPTNTMAVYQPHIKGSSRASHHRSCPGPNRRLSTVSQNTSCDIIPAYVYAALVHNPNNPNNPNSPSEVNPAYTTGHTRRQSVSRNRMRKSMRRARTPFSFNK